MKKQIITTDREKNTLIINIDNEKYFSITCEAYEKGKSKSDKNMIYAGCAHKEILAARPDLKLLVNLHLSDSLGQPMYAVENGFYYYQILKGAAKYHNKEKDDKTKYTKVLAAHLRISLNEVNLLIIELDKLPETQRKLSFSTFVFNNLDRWQNEAIKANKLIESL
jgi:hypothetical protein